MKRNTVLKSTLAISVLGVLILVGGCQTMDKDDAVTCPKCDKKVARFHPKKGMRYKKVACPSCKNVVTINDQKEITGTLHLCDACDTLVAECQICASKQPTNQK
jgi:phage FluMu protein Com